VQEFEDFAFASGRKYGDTGIVYGEVSGSYAGYHVMYYVGEGELYSNYIANNMKRTEDYNAWEENLLSAYTYASGNRFNLVG